MIAFRRDDRRHAAAPQAAARSFLGRDLCNLFFGQPTGGIDDEASAFQRVMADRYFDLVGKDLSDQRARKLRDVNFLMLRHQCIAREWIIMFPASKRADPSDRRIRDLEAGAIALPPDHALMKGRRDLSALEGETAI